MGPIPDVPRVRALDASAAALLVASRLAVRVAHPATVTRVLAWLAPALPPYLADPDADRVARSVRAVARRLPGSDACLPDALAARAMLERHGHRPELRVGVRKAGDGAFSAHAWVEHDGRVVVGRLADLRGFRALRGDEGEPAVPFEPGDDGR